MNQIELELSVGENDIEEALIELLSLYQSKYDWHFLGIDEPTASRVIIAAMHLALDNMTVRL